MATVIICLSVIICVGFICATFIHVHTKELESADYKKLSERQSTFTEKLKEIELLAEDAKKQLTAHNVAQGFKIGK